MTLGLRELTDADLPSVEGWFRDDASRRWLGDEAWPRQLLRLAALSTDRFAYAAILDGVLVGIADVELGEDRRAAVALIVAPDRRRQGIGTSMTWALARRPELTSAVELLAGVEDGNLAALALVSRAGFERSADDRDGRGFAYFGLRLGR